MANTRQILLWSLPHNCPLRPPETCTDPSKATESTFPAQQLYASLNTPHSNLPEIVDDIHITGHSRVLVDASNPSSLLYPECGYRISESLPGIGGPSRLKALCESCPANSRSPAPVGCAGTLSHQRLISGSVQENLASIITSLGLAESVAQLFPPTRPPALSFWIRSPLSPAASHLLSQIFTAFRSALAQLPADPDDASYKLLQLDELQNFINATTHAHAHQLPLHVRLTPPGHTDFGVYTIFPHCPACKIEADLPRWKTDTYPTEPYTCPICSTIYSPAATASTESYDHFDPPSLRQLLGPSAFQNFAHHYLLLQGASPSQAAAIIKKRESNQPKP